MKRSIRGVDGACCYDFEKINILEYAFGEGGGGHQKAYAVYAFINVDNCERPLTLPRGFGLLLLVLHINNERFVR